MKRILKWIFRITAAVFGLALAAVFIVTAYYYWIVSGTPGRLKTGVTAGNLGASVNVFAGTGGFPWMCAYDTPAAAVPFGWVRLGPDTASMLNDTQALNASGYYYGDPKILGFSHTRLIGADAEEGGCFRIFPANARKIEAARKKGRYAGYSHRTETGFPGYYAVRLTKENILAELTATPRVGIHRYTFTASGAHHLLLDVTSGIGDQRSELGVARILPETQEIEGSVRTYGSFSGRYGGLDLYFVARFNRPFAEWSVWNGAVFSPGEKSVSGNDIGVDATFADDGATSAVEVRLALSSVSITNARGNLEAETAGKSFETLVEAAKTAWETRLATIEVSGGSEKDRRIFYTALYHTLQMPTTFNDVNGEYTGFDRAVHRAEGFTYYTDFSLWDSFRTVHPLFTLIAPVEQRDMMVSLIEMAKVGGTFPRWPSGCGYTGCMFGTPADMTIAEAYLKGIRGFDAEWAYQCMRRTALEGPPPGSRGDSREGLADYIALGYCPSDKTDKSVSKTLEYAYADQSIALLAKALGHTEDTELFLKRGQNYRNVWDKGTQFFRPKDSSGKFGDFDPLALSYTDFDGKITRAYCEGSALQWRWSVPFDPEGLVSLFHDPGYFSRELTKYFQKSNSRKGWWNPHSYYWHGNEPYIHDAYLFNAAGHPEQTQYWVQRIREDKYGDDYVGLDGNDDGGTLSGWYVWSALGLYPLAGTTRYELGIPLFPSAKVHMGDKTLEIQTNPEPTKNAHVKQVLLNGKALERTWISHEEIAGGGILWFELETEAPKGQ